MAKGCLIPALICVLLCSFSIRIANANDGYCVRFTALSFVGVKEKGGNNIAFTDQYLQYIMSLQGWKPTYHWCSFFVAAMLDECGIPHKISGWSPTAYNKNDVIYTDGKFYQSYNPNDVLVMTLSYNHFRKSNRYKAIGHTGIVDRINPYSVRTIEGNTNDAGSRDGRSSGGVYVKIRPLNKSIHITRWKKA